MTKHKTKTMSKRKVTLMIVDNGTGKRLDKISPALYEFINKQFENKLVSERYQKLNKDVKSYAETKPIDLLVGEELKDELKKLKSNTVYYQGTFQKLVTLI